MIKKIVFASIAAVFVFISGTRAQGFLEGGQVHGNFEIDAQYYRADDKLGISDSSLAGKVYGMNAFGNIIYTNGNFSAGLRYEAYLPPLSGFDERLEGHGIPYWFANYKAKNIDLTVGHFYEQFGNGLVLRSYEEWTLGFDNSINGARVRYTPMKGVALKALAGTQRAYWEPFENNNRGIIRAFDAEFYVNEMFEGLADKKTKVILGGSFVSKYQDVEHEFIRDQKIFKSKMPKNVAAMSGRFNLIRGGFNFASEYAYKINDPSQMNNFIYKNGEAAFVSMSYSRKGLGITLSAKRIDNMSFKSDIYEQTSALDINYLPPLTKQHLYSLVNIYPYATQPNGEMGIQGQIMYTIPKKSKIGGKYGTKIELNYSKINSIEKSRVAPDISIDEEGTLGYESDFLKMGDIEYFQDMNVKISRKFNRKWKAAVSYVNLLYNIDVIEGHTGEPTVKANVYIADITYKVTPKKSIRFETQALITEQDKGDWAMAMIEFNIAPKWFFSVFDEFNYGNHDEDMQLHYYTGSIAYVKDATRIDLKFGRQREGLLCVGGVCRVVPASNGFSLTITSSF